MLEENVQLSISATLWLNKTEVRPNPEEEASSSPEETGFWSPVPCVDTELLRNKSVVDDTSNVIEVTGQDNGLNLKTGGWNLSDQAVADWTYSQVVSECVDHEKRSNTPLGTLSIGESKTTNDDKDNEHDTKTPEIDGATSSVLHEEPRENGTDGTHTRLSDVERESISIRKTSTLVHLNSETNEDGTAPSLSDPSHGSNLSTSEISSLEAVPVIGTSVHGNLELVGSLHHHDLVVNVEINTRALGGETEDSLLSFLETPFANQPPWRLWSEVATDEDKRWPDPLDGEWNAVSPLGGSSKEALENTGRDELTNNPAQIDIGGEVCTDLDWSNFRGVGCGEGLENTPWNTLENSGDDESLNVLEKKGMKIMLRDC